jgi:DNA repair exonuclease SbcCD ATPase subunit
MSTKKTETAVSNSVDQIRDILFGEQINLIEKRFAELEKSLSSAIEKLADNVDKTNKEIKEQISQSNKELSADNSQLEQQQTQALNKLESTINAKIIETESDLVNQLQMEVQKLDNKASHRKDLAQLLKDMATKLAD